MRLGARREGRHFFVADVEPLDLALAANGIGDAVEAVADNAVNALDPRCSKDFRELISNSICHVCVSQFAARPRSTPEDAGVQVTDLILDTQRSWLVEFP